MQDVTSQASLPSFYYIRTFFSSLAVTLLRFLTRSVQLIFSLL